MFIFKISSKKLCFFNSFLIPVCAIYAGGEKEFLVSYKAKFRKFFGFMSLFPAVEAYLFKNVPYVSGSFFCIIGLISIIGTSTYSFTKLCAIFSFSVRPCFSLAHAGSLVNIDNFKAISLLLVFSGLLLIPEFMHLATTDKIGFLFYLFLFFIFYSLLEGVIGLFMNFR